jgi:hypothetical protein
LEEDERIFEEKKIRQKEESERAAKLKKMKEKAHEELFLKVCPPVMFMFMLA